MGLRRRRRLQLWQWQWQWWQRRRRDVHIISIAPPFLLGRAALIACGARERGLPRQERGRHNQEGAKGDMP